MSNLIDDAISSSEDIRWGKTDIVGCETCDIIIISCSIISYSKLVQTRDISGQWIQYRIDGTREETFILDELYVQNNE